MNGRLLSPHVKDANRRGRNQRNARRQARRRRERLLAELAAIDGTGMAAQLLTPRENLDLLTAHLARAKAVMPRVRRTLRLARMGQSDGPPTNIQAAPPRPVRVLREQNRGKKVWPALLADAIEMDQPLTLVEAMAATTRHAEDGASPHVLLDFFVRASGLPWATAAQVLEQRRLIPGAFSPWDIRAIREARGFRDRYRNGRDAYHAAVSAGDIVAMRGDWTLFESEQLADLLPGLHMPRLLRRTAYLANLVRDHMGLTLDIHAFPSALPLVRHPL